MKRKRWVAILALAASQLAPCALRSVRAQEAEIKGVVKVTGFQTVGPTTPPKILGVSGAGTLPSHPGIAQVMAQNNSGANAFAAIAIIAGEGTGGVSAIEFGDKDDRDGGRIYYWHGTDDMAFKVGAVEKMRLLSNGNLGVGTSSPASRFHIKGTDAEIKFVTDLGSGLIFSDPAPQDPNAYVFRAEDEGAIFIFQTALADEDPNTTQTTRLVILSDGKIGLTEDAPGFKLDVDGEIFLRNTDDPGVVTGGGVIFADSSGNLMVRNAGDTTATQITSHKDSRSVDGAAISSFGDSDVVLPFSIHHTNDLIGKGSVVDMAKMVGFVEEMMQASLGLDEGRLVYDYDLPTTQALTLDEWRGAIAIRQADSAIANLQMMDWIEVELGPNGEIPPEAVTGVPETVEEDQVVAYTEQIMDFDLMRVVTVEKEKVVTVQVPTGATIKKLAEGWRFREGKLYRRPSVEDIDVEAMVDSIPDLPQWIMDRLGPGAVADLDESAFIDQIRAQIEARSGVTPETQIVDAGEGAEL